MGRDREIAVKKNAHIMVNLSVSKYIYDATRPFLPLIFVCVNIM